MRSHLPPASPPLHFVLLLLADSASPLDQASGPTSLGDFCCGKRVAFLLWLRMFLETLSSHPHAMDYTCWAVPSHQGLEVLGLRTEHICQTQTHPTHSLSRSVPGLWFW